MRFVRPVRGNQLLLGVALAIFLAAASGCLAPLPVAPAPQPAQASTAPAVTIVPAPPTPAAVMGATAASSEPVAPAPAADAQATAAPAGGPDQTALKNATYELPNLGTIQLADGAYRQQYGSGATEVNQVTFQQATFGDLTGKGTNDAAVVLALNSGGSGEFIYLVAMLDQNGTPQQAANHLLGDRVLINSLAIKDQTIGVDMLTQGPNDPMCCPTEQLTQTYQLTGNNLVLASQTSPAAAETPAPVIGQAANQPATQQPVPASGPGAPRRIQFAPGATSATVQGSLPGRGADRWVLKAQAGQSMTVQLQTTSGEAILIIFGVDGDVLISDHAGATQWSGTLPTTQDYYIDVRSVSDYPTGYALTVTIPPQPAPPVVRRIQFAPGATSATVYGKLPPRGNERWVVNAAAGQNMTVDLSYTSGQAILIIFGADGDVLISDHTGATHWSGTLPKTQDYYIDVRSVSDSLTAYALTVTIPPVSSPNPQPHGRRIYFRPGSTSATVYGHLPAYGLDRWILGARAGQVMQVNLNGNGVLVISGPGGNVLLSDHAGATSWKGTLPTNGDYVIDIKGGAAPGDYALAVSVK